MPIKRAVYLAGIAAITVIGLVALFIDWVHVAVAAALVLLAVCCVLLADLRSRLGGLRRRLDKLGKQKPARPVRAITSPSASLSLSPEARRAFERAELALDAAGERMISALAMERLAEAERHQELRTQLSALRKLLDENSARHQ